VRLPSLWSACFVFHSTFTLFDLCRGHVSPHSYVRRIWHVSLRARERERDHDREWERDHRDRDSERDSVRE